MRGLFRSFPGWRPLAVATAFALAIGTLASTQDERSRAIRQELRAGDEGDEDSVHEDVEGRAEYDAVIRVPEGETRIPQERYIAALDHMSRMRLHSLASGGVVAPTVGFAKDKNLNLPAWSPLGPSNKGGRTRALAIDPATPNTMYAGGVAGGIFKSTDGGANWTPMSDLIARIAISSLAIAPTVPSTIYAGTGEIFAGDGVQGLGIFKSTDSGVSWTALTNTLNSNFNYVSDVVVSPSNASRVYASTWSGVFRSLDAGATWSQVVVRNHCNDLAIRTDTGATDTVFVTCGFSTGALLRNTDAGGAGAWTVVFDDGASASFGRAKIAISPATQSTIYLLVADGSNGGSLYGVFRSTSSGDTGTWTTQRRFTDVTNDLNRTQLSNLMLTDECAFGADQAYHQGSYDLSLVVDPTNTNIIYTGGIYHMRSDDGGVTWGLIDRSGSLHVDVHVLMFHPTNTGVLYSGNDGGLYKTVNPRGLRGGVTGQPLDFNTCTTAAPGGAVTWTSLNQGYETYQFYHGTAYAGGASYFAGAQDNGTNKGTDAGGRNGWTALFGGDGGVTGIDPGNENNMYGETQNFGFMRSTNAGVNWSPAVTGFADAGILFITPFSVDPNNGQRVWTGGSAIWRTFDGASNWVQASTALGANIKTSAVTVSPFNSGNTVYVGSTAGDVLRNTTSLAALSTTTWTAATRPRTGVVSSIAVDPTNANNVYATYSTFGGFKVWKSTNAGATFAQIDGTNPFNLPDVPVHSIVVDPDAPTHLIIGTDLGVFSSFDGGTSWGVENTGFANVSTDWLTIKGLSIYAFTHGRGAWRVNKSTTLPTVSINDVTVAEGNAGTTNANFTVSLSASSASALSVNYVSADGTAVGGGSATQTNAAAITIPSSGNATAYPSNLTIAGATGNVLKATVTLTGFSHTYPRDVDVLLVGPAGQKVVLMSDVSNGTPASNLNFTFDDSAAGSLTGSALASGTYKPTNLDDTSLGEVPDAWGAPAPAAPYASTLSTFNGTAPNGTWSLYVVDDFSGDAGSFAGGWTLNLITSGGDYSPVSGTVNFAAGETSKTVTVPVNGDVTIEPNETFTVNLSNASPGLSIADAQGLGTIQNDDSPVLPTISVGDVTVTEGNAGTVNANFSVTLSASSLQTITVSAVTAANTATAPADYATTGPTTLTFNPGVTSQTFTVLVAGDTIDEANETFFVNLSSPTNATILDSQGQGTITDDDTAPTISISDVSVTEGNSGTASANFTVSLSAASGQTVTVSAVTAANTATAPADYAATGPTTLTFNPGITSQTFTVLVAGDVLDELNETFFVNLSSPSNATILDNQGIGTITDDDATPTLSIGDVTATEGNAGTVSANFSVTLSAASGQTVTVSAATAPNTASAPADFAATGPTTLTFNPGTTTQTFTVLVAGDVLDELNETFFVNLSSPTNATILDSQGLGTITDDDATPTLSINDVSVSEGNAGTVSANFTVTLSAASGQTVTVQAVTAANSAATPADFVATGPTTLTFNPGTTTQTFTVPVVGDVLDEVNETFFVNLSIPANATIADNQGLGTINDDDATPSLSINDVSVTEGNAGPVTATFTVSLSAASGQTVTVSAATANNTAVAPGDYTAVGATTLTFAPGVTTQTFPVTVNGDATTGEGNESFFVNLSSPSPSATISKAQGAGTILDDDGAQPSLTVNDVTLVEGNAGTTNFQFTVSLLPAAGGTVTVSAVTANGTAVSGSDYTTTGPTTLTFLAGQTTQTFTVPAIGDTTSEGDETFVVNLSSATGGAVITDAQGVGTIVNDDAASITVSVLDARVSEGYLSGSTILFPVVLSAPPTGPVSVQWTTQDLPPTTSASPGLDYTASNGTVTFAVGETLKLVPVAVLGDAVIEPNETFLLALSNPTAAAISRAVAMGTILNDDGPTLSVTDYAVVEGTGAGTTNLAFTVITSQTSATPITVNYATADGTATAGSDYTTTTGTVTLPPGYASLAVLVPVTRDAIVEPNETVLLNLTSPTGATLFDSQGVGTIQADDGLLVSIADKTTDEGNAGFTAINFKVTLSASSPAPVTVDYATADGTATAPADYTAATGTVTFGIGEQTKTITIQVVGDAVQESYETFLVNLSNPTGGAAIGDGQGQGTITNTDGHTDRSRLMFHNFVTNRLYRWHMKNGNTLDTFNWVTPWATDPGWTVGAVADFDQDGQLDYLWHNVDDGRMLFWYIDGDNLKGFQFLPYTMGPPPGGGPNPWRVATTFDADGNGTQDIVFYNSGSGLVRVMLHDNAVVLGQVDLAQTVLPPLKVVAAGDVNGDGDDELILYNATSGQTVAWNVTGPALTGVITYPDLQSTAQDNNLVSTKTDFNNDGLPDFLWHNPTPTGVFSVWFMNGTARLGTGVFLPFTATDPVWKVVGSANVW